MRRAALAAALVAAGPGWAETDILDLTSAERAALRSEIRALLLEEPEIVAQALNPPSPVAQETQQRIADDKALLAALEPEILNGNRIALFIGADCGTCARAAEELAALSREYGATFILHDTGDTAAARLADRLGMTDLPFYVLPGMILRGHIPKVVLPRYLD
ncbi:hypothetical protein FIU94_13340 [Sulfitobacter sp. THAF37]|uniref:disulfide bond formation protein DsbA n=1 Tax=Sulfitobacter sp. THAF37 TaxID=2587855 RepID=UPI0012A8E1FF|nr:disulfide bond formation protein DsbA [Sulfitobacter sp. THAF37]QFT59811.1 hypothetical protein FIU94_13340 [Sulfitobacter sp. THAF37]